ncbi:amidoligase family protein [Salinarimonas rosea]|uniref:amidoligase family protein n=1 Tax=Salinarimonas rosea TaxID=552063 RepID=UPI00042A1FF4|nr:amidoligase family protein [Salinarimonas rosea]
MHTTVARSADLSSEDLSLSAPELAKPRRVGVEIEFMGASARAAAIALAHDLGGSVEVEDPHAFRVCGTRFGPIAVEMDLRHVHPHRHPALANRLTPRAAAWLGLLASPLAPRELITAPIPISRLPELDQVVASLRSAGARGRGAVLFDSLGLHFNVDPPRMDAATLTAFLKAYLLLSAELRRETAGGSLRRAFALPPEFPRAYARRVLAPGYWPDMPRLMSDYLSANPTRRRALDLLPIFAHLDEERVRAAVPDEKIGPRPVLHYRLSQAHLSDPEWTVRADWERWMAIERLAADADELCRRTRALDSMRTKAFPRDLSD